MAYTMNMNEWERIARANCTHPEHKATSELWRESEVNTCPGCSRKAVEPGVLLVLDYLREEMLG